MAKKAGFDAVDVKCCHGYLLNELLTARNREGTFGGEYSARTKFLKEVVSEIDRRIKIPITVRMDIYNNTPAPCNWGCDANGTPDLQEPIQLARELVELGVVCFGVSAGAPQIKPYISRPYNKVGPCAEHPLISIANLIEYTGRIQKEIPDIPIVGTAYSSLRDLAAQIGAGVIHEGKAQLIGFARGALAYPEFANSILTHGKMERSKSCIACGKCVKLITSAQAVGCSVYDERYS